MFCCSDLSLFMYGNVFCYVFYVAQVKSTESVGTFVLSLQRLNWFVKFITAHFKCFCCSLNKCRKLIVYFMLCTDEEHGVAAIQYCCNTFRGRTISNNLISECIYIIMNANKHDRDMWILCLAYTIMFALLQNSCWCTWRYDH